MTAYCGYNPRLYLDFERRQTSAFFYRQNICSVSFVRMQLLQSIVEKFCDGRKGYTDGQIDVNVEIVM